MHGGEGKSSFINLVEYNLRQEDDCIIIKFNPRFSKTSQRIQEDFFALFYKTLSRYDSRFSTSFIEYLYLIDAISGRSILISLHPRIFHDKNYLEKEINDAIRCISKKIIVIVENFDRLLFDEMVEIFKLIDGNASFNNVVFLTAYDKKHVQQVLNVCYSQEGDRYADKFFNVEWQVPIRPYAKILKILKDSISKKVSASDDEIKYYSSVLDLNIGLIQKYLPTLRDVKRFTNIFVFRYQEMKDDVDFCDFFLLYLIRYKYNHEYIELSQQKYITESSRRFMLNVDDNSKPNSYEILSLLFGREGIDKCESINNINSFEFYFFEHQYFHLKPRELNDVINSKEFKLKIENIKERNLIGDLTLYLNINSKTVSTK